MTRLCVFLIRSVDASLTLICGVLHHMFERERAYYFNLLDFVFHLVGICLDTHRVL